MKRKMFRAHMIKDYQNYLMKSVEDAATNGKYAAKESDNFKGYVYSEFALLHARLLMVFMMHTFTMKGLNEVYQMTNTKQPNKKEFAAIRAEINRMRKSALKTLLPLQAIVEEARAREKKAAEMTGYG